MSKTSSATAQQINPPILRILGAGPAGVAAAYALTKNGQANVEVLEVAPGAGGNSSSFRIEDIWCDYGSHRFHPVADPNVLADVKTLLGDDLFRSQTHSEEGERWALH